MAEPSAAYASLRMERYFAERKYNVIILAGGLGTRMGNSSDYIPKALVKIGLLRAIDHIITRYELIAKRVIIGVCAHSDLLRSYITNYYSHLDISFSIESTLHSTSRSFAYCLDSADSRYPTIVQFCDLIMRSPMDLVEDSLYIVDSSTTGVIGSFRHSILSGTIIKNVDPVNVSVNKNGLAGFFSFGSTPNLKAISYLSWDSHSDFTDDIVAPYSNSNTMKHVKIAEIYEFGTSTDLEAVRETFKDFA